MENMDKGITVPKWVLINGPKIPQMLENLSVQIVCPSPIVWDFDEKRLHWASVVRDCYKASSSSPQEKKLLCLVKKTYKFRCQHGVKL